MERQYDAVESSFEAARKLKEASAKQREPALDTMGQCTHIQCMCHRAIVLPRPQGRVERDCAVMCCNLR